MGERPQEEEPVNSSEQPTPNHEADMLPEASPLEPPHEEPKTRKSGKRKRRHRIKRAPIEAEEIFTVPQELFELKGRTFSVINQKGGCGKTTTAINLAASLVKEGFQVLVIDLDPQANASLGLGLHLMPEEKNVYHLFKEPNLIASDLVRVVTTENLHVIPSSRLLSSLAVELLSLPNWEYSLRSHLRPLKQNYHFLFIDCPPALNSLTVNALTASDNIIIPLQTHYFSLEGMKELFLTVHLVREVLNPLLKAGFILPTLFDRRTKINLEMLQSIRDYFKDQVLETVIHSNVRLIESVMHGLPVSSYDPTSKGAKDYRSLARELVRKEAVLFNPVVV